MGRKFSEFSSGKQVSFFDDSELKKDEIKKNISEDREEDISKNYEKYSQMGSDQLMSEFLRMSREKIADGSLDSLDIKRMEETLFPHLSPEQKGKFKDLMGLIGK